MYTERQHQQDSYKNAQFYCHRSLLLLALPMQAHGVQALLSFIAQRALAYYTAATRAATAAGVTASAADPLKRKAAG